MSSSIEYPNVDWLSDQMKVVKHPNKKVGDELIIAVSAAIVGKGTNGEHWECELIFIKRSDLGLSKFFTLELPHLLQTPRIHLDASEYGHTVFLSIDGKQIHTFILRYGNEWVKECSFFTTSGNIDSISCNEKGSMLVVADSQYKVDALPWTIGGAHVYFRKVNNQVADWVLAGTLNHPYPEINCGFGCNAVIDRQGDKIAVTSDGSYRGKPNTVHIFSMYKPYSSFSTDVAITSPDMLDSFGMELCFSSENDTLYIGAPTASKNGVEGSGDAYETLFIDGEWSEIKSLNTHPNFNTWFGSRIESKNGVLMSNSGVNSYSILSEVDKVGCSVPVTFTLATESRGENDIASCYLSSWGGSVIANFKNHITCY